MMFSALLLTCPVNKIGSKEYYNTTTYDINLAISSLVGHMRKNNYTDDEIEIIDIVNLRPQLKQLIEYFKQYTPSIIGISAPLSGCYGNLKLLTALIRNAYPEGLIVVGGSITGSAEVILKKCDVDVCIVGDGEISWVQLLSYVKKGNFFPGAFKNDELKHIKGAAYIGDKGQLNFHGYGIQLDGENLYLPDFDIIKKGLQDKPEILDNFFRNPKQVAHIKRFTQGYGNTLKGKEFGFMPTSKGCVARCTFCSRFTRGYRKYEINLIEEFVIELRDKYNVTVISILDENFGSDVRQAKAFAVIMKKLGILWGATGVRCKTFSYDDLKFLKDHNMFYMKFGIESGSQFILDVMQKSFKVGDVFNAISNLASLGIYTQADALIIGMPGENRSTTIESAQFIAKLRYMLNMDYLALDPYWILATPGTPVYEYAEQVGIIGTDLDSQEKYLLDMDKYNLRFDSYGSNNIYAHNFNPVENKEAFFWLTLFRLESKKAYIDCIINSNKSIIDQLIKQVIIVSVRVFLHHVTTKNYILALKVFPQNLLNFLITIGLIISPRLLLYSVFKVASDIRFYTKRIYFKNRKIKNFFTEDFVIDKSFAVNKEYTADAKTNMQKSLRHFVKRNKPLLNFEHSTIIENLRKGNTIKHSE